MNKGSGLQKAWNEALKKNKAQCPLHEKDIAILEDFSLGLGKSDVNGHRRMMEPAVMRLNAGLEEARQQSLMQGRMYRNLGIGAGVVLAVILI